MLERIKYKPIIFDVEKCNSGPLKEDCYKEGAKTKTYSVSIKSELHKEQIAFQ
jgi:hypothetical protein